MMTQILMMMSTAILFSSNKTKSPMTLCATLITVSSMNFIVMTMTSSTSMVSLILAMIFLGGIIMMFMILCSIMPNYPSKSNKSKKLFTTTMLIMSIFLGTNPNMLMTNLKQEMSWFLETSMNTPTLMAIMILYFVMFNKAIKTNTTSMRTLEC